MHLPWQPFLLLGLFNAGLTLSFIVSFKKTCSFLVSLYRDVTKHYGQQMYFKFDHLPVLIGSLQRGTRNESVAMVTSSRWGFTSDVHYLCQV